MPTINSLIISSNNSTQSLAKEGDLITLYIGSSESITTPTVSFDIGSTNVTPSVSGSGTSYTASYTTLSGQNGSVSNFKFRNFFDTNGNSVTSYTSGWSGEISNAFTGESYIKCN
jgi:hypothetical protein